jgi:hypothetical protein
MARDKRWKDAETKRDSGRFIQLPLSVLNGRAYLDCSPHARMLLIDLVAQYHGNNNGDLACPWKWMKPRGWRSEATLNKAKKELLESGLIVETRMGARPNKCSLYALTCFALDENPKLEITNRSFPRGKYKLKDPVVIDAKPPESVQLTRIIKTALLATGGGVRDSA